MHLQRNAYQNYILLLTNNFRFYILQIFKAFNFLSVFFVFAKNQFANLITRGFPKGRRANPLHALEFAYNGLANGTHKRKPHCYSEKHNYQKWIASAEPRNDKLTKRCKNILFN